MIANEDKIQAQDPQPVYLLDASIYIFRSYFALPPNWESKEGYSTEAVYGYTCFLIEFIRRVRGRQPIFMAAAFDESLGSCFRNEIYDDYKCSRALPDEELAFQLQGCRDVSEILGIACFASERYEADDLIGSLAKAVRSDNAPVRIVTKDKDLSQLVSHVSDSLWDYADDQLLFRNDVIGKFGVPPEKIADYLALVGDSSDDIPGVPGVGPKTAVAILNYFDGVEHILETPHALADIDIRGAKSLGAKMSEHREQIMMAKALATICCDAPLDVGYFDRFEHKYKAFSGKQDLLLSEPCWECFSEFCEDMGLGPRLLDYSEKQQHQY